MFTLVFCLQTIKRNEPAPHSDAFLGQRLLSLALHGKSTALNCAIPWDIVRSRGRNGAMWLAVYSWVYMSDLSNDDTLLLVEHLLQFIFIYRQVRVIEVNDFSPVNYHIIFHWITTILLVSKVALPRVKIAIVVKTSTICFIFYWTIYLLYLCYVLYRETVMLYCVIFSTQNGVLSISCYNLL